MANTSSISCAMTCRRRLLVSARKGSRAAPSATRDGASYPQYVFQAAAILGFTSRITQRLIGRPIECAAAVGVPTSLCPLKRTLPCRLSQSLHGRLHRSDFVAPHATVLSLKLASLRHAFDDGSEGQVCGDDARQREPGERI